MNRTRVYFVVAFGGAVWALGLMFDGWTLAPSFFAPVPWVTTAVATLLGAWDAYLWRIPFLHPWLIKRPDLGGTWRGTVTSSWVDPTTDQKPRPIEAYLVIRQSASTIHVCMFTRESRSVPLLANLSEADGAWVLSSIYRNEPDMQIQGRSRIHHGWVQLRARGVPPVELSGSYCTDRDTKGSLSFQQVTRRLVSDFSDAAAHRRASRSVKAR